MSKASHGARARPVIDRLHSARDRKVVEDDLQLLRRLVLLPAALQVRSLVLDEALFESTAGVKPLPISAFDEVKVDSTLGASRATESVIGWELPLPPKGSSLRTQIESLLPDSIPSSPSITYALCRIVTDDTSSKINLQLFNPGLDSVVGAFLGIHEVGKVIGKRPAWLEVLWRIDMQRLKIDALRNLVSALRATPMAGQMRKRLQKTRDYLKKVMPQDRLGTSTINSWLAMIPAHMARRLPKEVLDKLRYGEMRGEESINGIYQELDLLQPPWVAWPVLTLRSDGPVAAESESMLNELRQEINILDYKPVRDVCAYLADRPMSGSPTGADVMNATGMTQSESYHASKFLHNVITESYLPFLGSIGLQYRYLITSQERGKGNSIAVVEKCLFRDERETSSTRRKVGTMGLRSAVAHLEPINSQGPDERELPKNSFSVAVGSESLSMRLDLYDAGKSTWREPWNERRPVPRSSILHLTKAEPLAPEHSTVPLQRELDALSILWSFKGTRPARQWLFERMGYPSGTAEHVVPNLFKKRLVGLMYLPALEYCRLPEGIFACSKGMSARQMLYFTRWIAGAFPYCRILTNRSAGDVVTLARVPRLRSALASEVLRDRLEEVGCEFMVAAVQSYRSYYMTVLNRLYDSVSRNWIDPWS